MKAAARWNRVQGFGVGERTHADPLPFRGPTMKRSLLPTLLLAGCATAAPLAAPDSDDSPAPDGAGLLVVDLVDGTSLDAARAATGLDLRWVHAQSSDEALAEADVDDRDDIQAHLQGLSLVEAVEAPVEMAAFEWELMVVSVPYLRYPNDPMYDKQWNLGVVGAPAGWRVGGGRGVTVAVIDTGVTAVADLDAATVLEGVSFVPGTSSADDDQGHGTHVAGTISRSRRSAAPAPA
jgi:subtilisin family serine protease